jgi:hypothetical protein
MPRRAGVGEAGGGDDTGAVHRPDGDLTACVLLQDVDAAVAVVVARAHGVPVRSGIADDRLDRRHRRVYQPDWQVPRSLALQALSQLRTCRECTPHRWHWRTHLTVAADFLDVFHRKVGMVDHDWPVHQRYGDSGATAGIVAEFLGHFVHQPWTRRSSQVRSRLTGRGKGI